MSRSADAMLSEEVVIGSVDDIFSKADNAVDNFVNRSNAFFRRCGFSTVLVGLKHPSVLYFQGILDVNVLFGELVVNGYSVPSKSRSTPLRLFSMNEGSAQFLSTVPGSFVTESDVQGYDYCKEFRALLQELVEAVQPVGCVLCVASRVSEYRHWDVCFERHKLDLLPNLKKATAFSPFAEIEPVLQTLLDVEEGSRIARKMKISEEMVDMGDRLVESAHNAPMNTITVVCGGKGVGKSSTVRYLLNRFLGQSPSVLCIDLDIGQPEFTLCGSISAVVVTRPLIGPNYSHLKTPLKSYFIGDVNPVQCLNAYMTALESLIQFCHENEECSSMPWLVNTMGYTKGLGFDIIASIISFVKPHHVVQISGPTQQVNFASNVDVTHLRKFIPKVDHALMNSLSFTHHSANSFRIAETRPSSMLSSARLREIVAVAYFSSLLSNEGKDPILESQHIHTVASSHSFIFGDIVAITYKEGTINDACLGYGIVIDVSEDKVTVLSPVEKQLSQDIVMKTAPIQFKASVILSHFRDRVNTYPFFCTLDPSKLQLEQKVLMKALFGLD